MSGVRRRAEISLSAIVSNLASVADGAESETVADLRGDAYGHGLVRVASELIANGVSQFLVSPEFGVECGVGRLDPSMREVSIHVSEAEAVGSGSLIGAALFGLSADRPTVQAMRLVTEAVSVKRVPADRGVSYGYTYRTRAATTLVLAGLGYADGVPRVASNRAPVRVGSTTAPVTGRIAMDQFVVDVGETSVDVGDDVVLFGNADHDEPTVLDWSIATGIRPDVITTGLGSRIVRDYGRS